MVMPKPRGRAAGQQMSPSSVHGVIWGTLMFWPVHHVHRYLLELSYRPTLSIFVLHNIRESYTIFYLASKTFTTFSAERHIQDNLILLTNSTVRNYIKPHIFKHTSVVVKFDSTQQCLRKIYNVSSVHITTYVK